MALESNGLPHVSVLAESTAWLRPVAVAGGVNNLPAAVGFFDYEPVTVTAYDAGPGTAASLRAGWANWL